MCEWAGRAMFDLSAEEGRLAVAAVGYRQHSYVANDALVHHFRDPREGRQVRVVLSAGGIVEIFGDIQLWESVQTIIGELSGSETSTPRPGGSCAGAFGVLPAESVQEPSPAALQGWPAAS